MAAEGGGSWNQEEAAEGGGNLAREIELFGDGRAFDGMKARGEREATDPDMMYKKGSCSVAGRAKC